MSCIDWFKFENRDYDFPFYDHNPRVPKLGWIVLFFSVFVGFILQVIPDSEIFGGFLFFMAIFIPVLYYLEWDLDAIIRKPTLKEVGLAVLLFVGYMIYSILMGEVLAFFNLIGSEVVPLDYITLESTLSLVFSMMGEELMKFVPFMFFLRLFYKYSDNRKLSIILSMIVVLICFGLLHAGDMKSIVSVLVIQGLGSLFEFYGYIKTKNLMVSYTTHLCTDAFIFILILLGI